MISRPSNPECRSVSPTTGPYGWFRPQRFTPTLDDMLEASLDPSRFVRHTRILLGAAMLTALTGCTTYRIIRYRQPDARNQGMFPTRLVRKADAPFLFARATTLR